MRLPAEIKHLCAKIAHERVRPQQWQTAHELRKDAARVLASGTDVEGAVTWLQGLLSDALAQQAAGGVASLAHSNAGHRRYSYAQKIPHF